MPKVWIKWTMPAAAAAALLLGAACQTRHTVKLEPVEIKPIHITIDVNVKVDRALDDFFGDLDQAEEKIDATAPERGAAGKQ